MKQLVVYNKKNIAHYTRLRTGETKLGECVQTVSSKNIATDLKNSKATFVLVGLPEDIGVRANYGRGGAHTAWEPTLSNLLNVQSNAFLNGEELLVLGHINFEDLLKRSQKLDSGKESDVQQLRKLCAEIDERVTQVIQTIVEAGKIPIIIGGGHNNSYGNIKGSAMGLKAAGRLKNAAINCINCDAHSDFRALEGRHSGNGFSYAFHETFLDKYALVGLHENYNSAPILKELNKYSKKIQYSLFEDIFIRETTTFDKAISNALSWIDATYFGVELDMDAIENIPSSAKTSSGISATEARKFVSKAAQNKKVAYLHITEAAPVLSHIKTDNKTGKLIAYLVTDFMKSYLNN